MTASRRSRIFDLGNRETQAPIQGRPLHKGESEMSDEDLIKFAAEFRSGILGRKKKSLNMCFAICAPLGPLLSLNGVANKIVEGEIQRPSGFNSNHFWLTLEDGRVLDPTADQFAFLGFDFPPVYLGPPLQIHQPK